MRRRKVMLEQDAAQAQLEEKRREELVLTKLARQCAEERKIGEQLWVARKEKEAMRLNRELRDKQLAAAAVRSNAVRNSIVAGKPPSWGGSQQTPRLNLEPLGATAAAQSVACAQTLAFARLQCKRKHDFSLSNAGACIAPALCDLKRAKIEDHAPFLMTSTSRLLSRQYWRSQR